MPQVSILLPYHNADPAGLNIAIKSVLMQQGKQDRELVLVNNANPSDAPCVRFANEMAEKHNDLIHHVYEAEAGIAYALNTGLRHCAGRYIARMDADDVMALNRIWMQSEFLDKQNEIGLVSGLVDFKSELPDARGYMEYVSQVNSWKSEEDIYDHRFIESPFAHPSVMFRKELVEKYGGYTTAPVPEDYELWLRWMHHGVRMAKLNAPVIRWNDHSSRLSRTHSNYSAEAFDTVRYHYLARWLAPRLSTLPPVHVWGGKLARKKVKLLEEQGIKISGYIDVKEPGPGDDFIHYTNIPDPGKIFIISMVSNRGKYAEVRDFLLKKGYRFEKDFVLAG